MSQSGKKLLLASTSRYRQALLSRLGLPFDIAAPDCDETPGPGESPTDLVLRLAAGKARSLASHYPSHLIIGSDQVADRAGTIVGKPGDVDTAVEQLMRSSGQSVIFRTGLCLLDAACDTVQLDCINVEVRFRQFSEQEARRYVAIDMPLDCAGSIKAEALGVSLFEAVNSTDATALVGLPLIRLGEMLRRAGLSLP